MSDTPRTDFILKASDRLANCKDVTPYAVQVVCRQLERELAAERKRADEAEKDAKRYRWLRGQHEGIGPLNYDADGVMMPVEPTEIAFTVFRPDPSGDESLSVVGCIPGELDAAIDEAMKNG